MALTLVPPSATKLWQALSGSNIGMPMRHYGRSCCQPLSQYGWAQASFAQLHSHWLEATLSFIGYSMPLQA